MALEMFKRVFMHAKTRNLEPPLAAIDSLIGSYPNSLYVPEACKHGLLLTLIVADSSRIADYCTILIHSNPNRDYAISGFDNILTVIPPSSISSFCDSIATTYPNTRVGARAIEKLAALKAEKP